ncbi:hypothetical protein HFO39_34765 [Rhizobium leguminosarum]|uniref:hypothetical protein n=1 Tax=Rhizobium TaxID=379 RepID=UPI0015B8BDED|nr:MULTISPECIES: hypothetical protein [Rhizobium]MBY3185569.1 hypothetical protein [Rhizobium laguerreae]MBY3239076.1 hypothetical protein [Rhizobium laguerreae]MBY5639846.1 hypothetical protein [Rhizobium leguminosarum]MBY5728347.1 hypothetical protein [Rhizobium leguminosarum]QSW27714.1 hypothetical protein J0664_32840 [Rhizobium leguminosarum]
MAAIEFLTLCNKSHRRCKLSSIAVAADSLRIWRQGRCGLRRPANVPAASPLGPKFGSQLFLPPRGNQIIIQPGDLAFSGYIRNRIPRQPKSEDGQEQEYEESDRGSFEPGRLNIKIDHPSPQRLRPFCRQKGIRKGQGNAVCKKGRDKKADGRDDQKVRDQY